MDTRALTSPDDITVAFNQDPNDPQGRFKITAGGVEVAAIEADGTGSGWSNLLGGSLPPVDSPLDLALRERVTVEELVAGVGPVAATAGTVIVCFVAPFACNIAQASLVSLSTDIAASNVDYYTVTVNRYRAGTSATIATQTTQDASTSKGIVQMQDWNLDPQTFDATNQQLVKSDVVTFEFAQTGTPTDLASVFVQVRYEPT